MFITIATTSAAALTAATVAIFPEKNPVVPIPVVPYEAPPPVQQKYVCDDCTINEAITLSFLQERGIEDKAALATVMGNIKQESNFTPNICEGGAKVPYASCTKGGYGLIQWTSKKDMLDWVSLLTTMTEILVNWELNLGIWLTNLSGQSMNFI